MSNCCAETVAVLPGDSFFSHLFLTQKICTDVRIELLLLLNSRTSFFVCFVPWYLYFGGRYSVLI